MKLHAAGIIEPHRVACSKVGRRPPAGRPSRARRASARPAGARSRCITDSVIRTGGRARADRRLGALDRCAIAAGDAPAEHVGHLRPQVGVVDDAPNATAAGCRRSEPGGRRSRHSSTVVRSTGRSRSSRLRTGAGGGQRLVEFRRTLLSSGRNVRTRTGAPRGGPSFCLSLAPGTRRSCRRRREPPRWMSGPGPTDRWYYGWYGRCARAGSARRATDGQIKFRSGRRRLRRTARSRRTVDRSIDVKRRSGDPAPGSVALDRRCRAARRMSRSRSSGCDRRPASCSSGAPDRASTKLHVADDHRRPSGSPALTIDASSTWPAIVATTSIGHVLDGARTGTCPDSVIDAIS